jgi:Rieske Fe-S protein
MTDQELKDAERTNMLEKLCEKIDKLCGKDENSGPSARQFFQDALGKKLEFGGVKYDYMTANANKKSRGGEMEIDILLVNGNAVAIVEVKNRIHPNFVTELTQVRVKKFRELYPEYRNHKVYLGIAAFSFDKEVSDKAEKYGVGIVKQIGESVETETENLKAY